jgi:hypothetical protein
MGIPDYSYNFSVFTEDPDDDDIQYGWDFGDGNPIIWTEFFKSGEICNITHSWVLSGNYPIRVKARDINYAESNWSDPIVISIDQDNTIELNVMNPENALYINNIKIRPFLFRNPLIIGYINITVDVYSINSEIESVEFYIDNELKKETNKNTYFYRWDEKSFGKYTVKLVAYDNMGNQKEKEFVVWRFSL